MFSMLAENLLRMLDFNAENSGFHDAGQDSACVVLVYYSKGT